MVWDAIQSCQRAKRIYAESTVIVILRKNPLLILNGFNGTPRGWIGTKKFVRTFTFQNGFQSKTLVQQRVKKCLQINIEPSEPSNELDWPILHSPSIKRVGGPVAHPSFLNPPQPNASGFYTFLFSLRILINLCTERLGGLGDAYELFIHLGQILSKISPRLSLSRYCIYIYLFVLTFKKLDHTRVTGCSLPDDVKQKSAFQQTYFSNNKWFCLEIKRWKSTL